MPVDVDAAAEVTDHILLMEGIGNYQIYHHPFSRRLIQNNLGRLQNTIHSPDKSLPCAEKMDSRSH